MKLPNCYIFRVFSAPKSSYLLSHFRVLIRFCRIFAVFWTISIGRQFNVLSEWMKAQRIEFTLYLDINVDFYLTSHSSASLLNALKVIITFEQRGLFAFEGLEFSPP